MFSYNIKGDINDKKIYPFTIERYKQIGMDFCLSLFDYINPQNEENIENNNESNKINNNSLNNIEEQNNNKNNDHKINIEKKEQEEDIGALNINKYFVI